MQVVDKFYNFYGVVVVDDDELELDLEVDLSKVLDLAKVNWRPNWEPGSCKAGPCSATRSRFHRRQSPQNPTLRQLTRLGA